MTGWLDLWTIAFELGASTVLHGTVLACITWILCATVLRRTRPAVQALLWTVVLVKFLIPPVLPGQLGLSTWLVRGASRTAPGLDRAGYESTLVRLDGEGEAKAGEGTVFWPGLPEGSIPAALVLLYCLGLGVIGGRSAVDSLQMWRRVRKLPGPTSELRTEVKALGQGLALRRVPRIKVSDENSSPFVIGLTRPTLVIPGRLFEELGRDSRRALIVHELAHIRRGDLLVRMLQNVCRTLLFFWPPVWWVCRRIERFSEMACDQWAVTVGSVSPGRYADSLLQVVRQIAVSGHRYQEVALARQGRVLEERFEMIMKYQRGVSPRMNRVTLAILAAWVWFALAGGTGSSVRGAAQEERREERVLKIEVRGEPDKVLPADLLEKFPEADTDGNGQLTMAEFNAYMGTQPSEAGTTMIICRLEEGSDEPVCDVTSNEPEASVLHHDHLSRLAERVLDKHPEADLDGDGTLSKEEFEAHVGNNSKSIRVFVGEPSPETGDRTVMTVREEEEIHGEPRHRRQVRVISSGKGSDALLERFPEADLDKNGVLSEDEVSALRERLAASGGDLFLVRTEEVHLDMGGDKDSTVREFSWTTDDGREMTIKVRGDVKEMDLDGDGNISLEEARTFATSHEHAGHEGDHFLYFRKEDERELTAEETALERERMAEERRAQLLRKYPEADSDGDGVLSESEAESLAKRLQEIK